MNGYHFTTVLVILAGLTALTLAAVAGSLPAAVILAVLVTVLLVGIGAGIALAVQKLANEKSQADFVANAKENLALMSSLQSVQNRQNQTIMQQLSQAARLPLPANGADNFFIDDGIFNELGE
jgi:uncharacterized membrane protein YeiB